MVAMQSSLIYEKIQEAVDIIVLQLSEQKGHDTEIKEDISAAIDNLTELKNDISLELTKLKEHSEWKKFVIAFYGETNAGKSTLIEAIRLLFKEQSILFNQQKFKEIQNDSGLTQEAFDQIRQEILDVEKLISCSQKELSTLEDTYIEPLDKAKKNVIELESILDHVVKTRSLWQKIIAIFISPIEKTQFINAEKKLSQLTLQAENESNQIKKTVIDLTAKKDRLIQDHKLLERETNRLIQYADGQIIGNGKSDFTRDNTEYDFNVNGQEFTLIDVPGIEGDESIVKAPINHAVSKAHAVFYVTKTARPPQTHQGDITGNKKGTLEKIKEHLGSQTEVWSIYNHPITSPRMLKQPLIDDELKAGLAAMDLKLKEELDEKYCQSIVLSARPAFLALTECIVPGSKDAKDQRKLLDFFESKQKIYEMSGLKNFETELYTNIIHNYKEKIKKSNHNKAYKILENSLVELDEIYDGFSSKAKKIKVEVDSSKSRIDVLLEQFTGSLHADGSRVLSLFRENVEDKIYKKIQADISNDDVKHYLKREMERESAKIEASLKNNVQKNAEEFKTEITKLIKRSNQHLNTITNMKEGIFQNSKFNISIKVDNGVQLLGLVSSGVGIVTGTLLLASNPVGWTVAFVGGALALAGAIIGVAKSVWSAFSSDYKMSQQRKAVGKSIDQTVDSIEEGINKMTHTLEEEMGSQMALVKLELDKPVKQCTAILQTLKTAKLGLTKISEKIQ